jgi:hypothetical protein
VNVVDQPQRADAPHVRLWVTIGLGLTSVAASILLLAADGIGGGVRWAHHAGASAAPLLLVAGAIAAVSVARPPKGRHGFMRLVAVLAFTAWGIAQLFRILPPPELSTMWPYCCSSSTPHAWSSRTRGRSSRHAAHLLRGAAGTTPDREDTGHAAQRPGWESATISLEAKSCYTRTRIGNTRARINRSQETEPGAISERELQGDLIAAQNAELSRLFEAGTIAEATRWRLQRRLDLEITRLTEKRR